MTRPQLSMAVPSFAASDPGSWQHLFDAAVAADESGVDRIVLSDHVVFGESLSSYGDPSLGGITGGRQPTGPDGHWLEPMTTLSVLAGKTSRVRLGTNILLAALRRPVVLAKAAATLDVLSGGRLDLGVGVGWQREEYDAAGLDFSARGALLDETIATCQELWRSRVATVPGSGGIHMMPKPVAAEGVPIWVSGRLSPRLIRRLARYGSGWIPWDTPDLPRAIGAMREGVAAAGVDPLRIGVVGGLRGVRDGAGRLDVAATVQPVPALIAAGVTDFRLAVSRLPVEREPRTEALGPLVSAFREASRSS
ncbi:TIGR03619 family F420-dependent LLM class oxidoreductase [Cryptosporangium sp. NPDC051539]|uniref:TIGR03619 family F420-dependent LLM class oxidoreductase n=1 Tax=Cryptosporangium sp. NPDC051539 TaxID=3363962 RepID=UPI0037896CEB